MKIFHSSVIAETRMRGWGEGPVSRVRKRGGGRTEEEEPESAKRRQDSQRT